MIITGQPASQLSTQEFVSTIGQGVNFASNSGVQGLVVSTPTVGIQPTLVALTPIVDIQPALVALTPTGDIQPALVAGLLQSGLITKSFSDYGFGCSPEFVFFAVW